MKYLSTRIIVLVLGLATIVAALTFGIYAESPDATRGSILAAILSALRWAGVTTAAVLSARYGKLTSESAIRVETKLNGELEPRITNAVSAALDQREATKNPPDAVSSS